MLLREVFEVLAKLSRHRWWARALCIGDPAVATHPRARLHKQLVVPMGVLFTWCSHPLFRIQQAPQPGMPAIVVGTQF